MGGVEEIVRQQVSLFHRHFHPVKIITGDGSRFDSTIFVEINPQLSSRHPEISGLQNNAKKNIIEINKFSDKIYFYLTKALKGFDILIAHNVLTMHYNLPLTFALHRLAKSKQIHIVGWNHDSPYFYDEFPTNLDKEPWTIMKYHNSNIHYITISESRKRQFSKLYNMNDAINVIPNGVDPIRFLRLDPLTVRIIKENNLFESDFILVQPSRLHPRKNIELSIEVIKALHDKGIHAKLLLTGAFDHHEEKTVRYYKKLRNLAKNLGVSKEILIMEEYTFKSGEKITSDRIIIRDLYHIADLLFLPSTQEGFGIPLLEAGMIKLPTVCSDIPPFKDIGGDQVCFFSLQDTPEEIARKILSYIRRIKPMGMFRNVFNNYVWDNIYVKHLKPYLDNIYSPAD